MNESLSEANQVPTGTLLGAPFHSDRTTRHRWAAGARRRAVASAGAPARGSRGACAARGGGLSARSSIGRVRAMTLLSRRLIFARLRRVPITHVIVVEHHLRTGANPSTQCT
jgi:hypothetical protein